MKKGTQIIILEEGRLLGLLGLFGWGGGWLRRRKVLFHQWKRRVQSSVEEGYVVGMRTCKISYFPVVRLEQHGRLEVVQRRKIHPALHVEAFSIK